jgi:hypothetical protein
MRKRRIKRLRELLVRHGNRLDALRLKGWTAAERKWLEKERKKYWDKLMAAPSDLLAEAAEELNEREIAWRRKRAER